jgi:hypothetical protein
MELIDKIKKTERAARSYMLPVIVSTALQGLACRRPVVGSRYGWIKSVVPLRFWRTNRVFSCRMPCAKRATASKVSSNLWTQPYKRTVSEAYFARSGKKAGIKLCEAPETRPSALKNLISIIARRQWQQASNESHQWRNAWIIR